MVTTILAIAAGVGFDVIVSKTCEHQIFEQLEVRIAVVGITKSEVPVHGPFDRYITFEMIIGAALVRFTYLQHNFCHTQQLQFLRRD